MSAAPVESGGRLPALPFVCAGDEGQGELAVLVRKRVLQCALSRICSGCGESLEHPLFLVGSQAEADANGFRLPPLHRACAVELLGRVAGSDLPALGHSGRVDAWVLVTTGGFDLERPDGTGQPSHVTFRPNAVTDVKPA